MTSGGIDPATQPAAPGSAAAAPEPPFRIYLREEVDRLAQRYSLSAGKAFLMWYAIESLRLDEDVALEASSFDSPNDKFVDLFYVDDEAERVVIAQGKFKSRGIHTPTVGELLSVWHTTDWLADPEALARDGRPDLADAAKQYIEAIGKGYSVEFLYIYCGPENREISDRVNLLNTGEQGGPTSRLIYAVHLGIIEQDHLEFIDVDTRISTEDLSFRPGDVIERTGTFGKALVITLPGAEVRRIYQKYGDSLFDRNVRLFLGARKGGVNAGLSGTLESPTDRPNFWAYNNGLTIVCDRYEPREGQVCIQNFSIVNGCQTTVSIGTSTSEAAAGTEVLAKIIACSRDAVVDSIIRFTNSQTPIRSWDITSQDRWQKTLKFNLAKEPWPYFYELRKGEAKAVESDDRTRFNRDETFQVITYDRLAQYLGAFHGLPSVAYASKRLLFTTYRTRVFPSDMTAEEAIFCWQAAYVATDLVKEQQSEAPTEDNQLALSILRRGGRMYVLAVMGILLRSRNGATYLSRLSREQVGSGETRRRLVAYAKLATQWYVDAVKDLLETGAELPVLLRSQETYGKLRDRVQRYWATYSLSDVWRNTTLEEF
jgi:hypothetical protein